MAAQGSRAEHARGAARANAQYHSQVKIQNHAPRRHLSLSTEKWVSSSRRPRGERGGVRVASAHLRGRTVSYRCFGATFALTFEASFGRDLVMDCCGLRADALSEVDDSLELRSILAFLRPCMRKTLADLPMVPASAEASTA